MTRALRVRATPNLDLGAAGSLGALEARRTGTVHLMAYHRALGRRDARVLDAAWADAVAVVASLVGWAVFV